MTNENTHASLHSGLSPDKEIEPAFFNIANAPLDKTKGLTETYIEERLFVTEYINKPEIPDFSLARCRVEPGVTTQLHSLSVHEWYVIESGIGLMELDSTEQAVSAGSIVQIPKGKDQRITNTGVQDLIFFCVCIPNFSPESYSTDE